MDKVQNEPNSSVQHTPSSESFQVYLLASVYWNSLTSPDANKLERIQQEFAALCFRRFLPRVHYSHTSGLEQLKLHTLHKRRYEHDVLFLIRVYLGYKFCLETISIRIPNRYPENFPTFNAGSYKKTVPQDAHQLMKSVRTLECL
jgi:hypothetical protein